MSGSRVAGRPPRAERRVGRHGAVALLTLAYVVAGLGALVLAWPRHSGHETPADPAPARSAATTAAAPRPAPRSPTPYSAAVVAAQRHGLRVWLEADLVKRWRAGRPAFQAGIVALGALAAQPGVAGFKIADEFGYRDGINTPDQAQAFLDAAAAGLRRVAPGKKIVVDMMVPELGCLPGKLTPPVWATVCMANATGTFPQLSVAAVTSYLGSGDIDALDLAPGLLPAATYVGWGTSLEAAADAAWQEVGRMKWSDDVELRARKALAHPGSYPGTPADARRDVAVNVTLPLQRGADAVDVWTWRQMYRGQMFRLADPGAVSNPLWQQLSRVHAAGGRLFTHFSPTSVEQGLDQDLELLSHVFTDVFVAAGIG